MKKLLLLFFLPFFCPLLSAQTDVDFNRYPIDEIQADLRDDFIKVLDSIIFTSDEENDFEIYERRLYNYDILARNTSYLRYVGGGSNLAHEDLIYYSGDTTTTMRRYIFTPTYIIKDSIVEVNNSDGNLAYSFRERYVEGVYDSQVQSFYSYENGLLSEFYVERKDNEQPEWKPSFRQSYSYDTSNNLTYYTTERCVNVTQGIELQTETFLEYDALNRKIDLEHYSVFEEIITFKEELGYEGENQNYSTCFTSKRDLQTNLLVPEKQSNRLLENDIIVQDTVLQYWNNGEYSTTNSFFSYDEEGDILQKNYYRYTEDEDWIYDRREDYYYSLQELTATENLSSLENLSVFPNPIEAGDYLHFSKSANYRHANFYDITGALLASSKTDGENLRVPPSLSAGIYLLQINDAAGNVFTQKIIVK